MARQNVKNNTHDFYCTKCGNKGIPIVRKRGCEREKFHKKKLFCLYCGDEINHIECRSMEEVEQFKIDFAKGVYNE